MKQFFTVLRFEFSNYLKSKVFVGITLVFMLIIGGVLSFPRISALLKTDSGSGTAGPAQKSVYALVNQTEISDGLLQGAFQNALQNSEIILSEETEEMLRGTVDDGRYAAAIILKTPLEYLYIVKTVGMYDTATAIIDEVLLNTYQQEAMIQGGLSAQAAQDILQARVISEVRQTGKNQFENFFYTYILIIALYMAIMLYGQLVATSVASEKSSRAMEILITSARPTSLMFGKIIGSGLAGLTQMAALLGSGFVFFNLNRSYWQSNAIIISIFDMPLSILLYSLLFFILGYFIYAFMFGALGSLASRTEDINTSIMPVMLLFIIAFMIVVFGMTSGKIDSALMVVCSYVPFSSPMAMFARIAMGEVRIFEIILSVILLIASTLGLGYLCARIYRIGVLLYGKPPKLAELFKMLRRQ